MGDAEVSRIIEDTYRVWVPIEDTEFMKSIEVDENGDWIVQGVMTSDDVDEENDSIAPEGMDCSYFLEKGWIKYEHGNRLEQYIGEPLEIRVGRFTHPTLHKSVNGIFVKGRLFKTRELARQAVKTIQDLQKSNTKRRMGWSIEGSVKERCRKTGKILKSVLRNVVLTMNPVNTMTWVELAKSFAKNHELVIDMEPPIDKSLDTSGMAEITPQSLEQPRKPDDEEDEQEKWIKLFRKYVEDAFADGAIHKSLMADAGTAAVNAFSYARKNGMSYDDACQFATYIRDRHEKIKSLIKGFGGDKMGGTTKSAADLLDAELEELKKALDPDEMDDEDQEVDSEDDSEEDEDYDDADDDADESDDEDYDDEDYDDEGYDDDEDSEEGFAKSFSKSETARQALEVSDFLNELVQEIGYTMDGFNKSLSHVAKQQSATVKALQGIGELMKSMAKKLETVEAENAELRKSLDELLQRPVGRRGVTTTREVATITKGMNGGRPAGGWTRAQVLEELNKSFDAGNFAIGKEIARYEAGVPLEMLNLPNDLREKFGLPPQ